MVLPIVGIVNHHGYDDPGIVGRVLKAEGFDWRLVAREDLLHGQPLIDDFAMMMSLGSWKHADLREPAIAAEALLLQRAGDAHIPTVGVCFGAQLMAVMRGQSLFELNPPRLGYFDVGTLGRFLFFNEYGFTAPDDVEILVSDDSSCFAFRSDDTLALQFHIDATADLLERWTNDPIGTEKLLANGISQNRLLEEARQTEDTVTHSVHQLLMPLIDIAKARWSENRQF